MDSQTPTRSELRCASSLCLSELAFATVGSQIVCHFDCKHWSDAIVQWPCAFRVFHVKASRMMDFLQKAQLLDAMSMMVDSECSALEKAMEERSQQRVEVDVQVTKQQSLSRKICQTYVRHMLNITQTYAKHKSSNIPMLILSYTRWRRSFKRN